MFRRLFDREKAFPLRKVLVADDEPHIVKALRRSLLRAGYAVVTTTKSKEVLDKARKEQVDLIPDYSRGAAAEPLPRLQRH
jgi:PleD family two-component response regulator